MSMEDEYWLSPGTKALADTYAAAEHMSGVPVELLALVVNAHGGHVLRGEAPASVDVQGVMAGIIDRTVASGVDPLPAVLGALAGQGERISA